MRVPHDFRSRCSTGYTLIGLGIVGLGASLHRPSAPLICASVILIMGPLGILFTLRHVCARMSLERRVPESAFEGDRVEVSFRLQNRSSISLFFPVLCDVFGPELHDHKQMLYPGRVNPGETIVQRFDGHCLLPRGIYKLGPTALRLCDPFGFFQVIRHYTAAPELKVYPQLTLTGVERLVGRSVTATDEDRTRNRSGDSSEFFSVREYQHGDSRRRIHWRLSAHLGFPVVREYAPTATGNLAFVLDLSRPSLVGWGRNSSVEFAIRIAASCSSKALRQGRRVELHAGGSEQNQLPPSAGADQMQRILDALVTAQPRASEPDLPELLDRLSAQITPGSTVVLNVTPYLFENPELLERLTALRQRGHRVIALVVDGDSFRRLKPVARESSGEWQTRSTPPLSLAAETFSRRLRRAGIASHLIRSGARIEHVMATEAR